MTKNFTLLAGLAFTLNAAAQTPQTRPVPRPQAPGVEFALPQPKATAATSLKLRAAKMAASQTKKVATTPASKLRPLQLRTIEGTLTYDTLLVTGYSKTVDDEQRNHTTITYDAYGHRQMMKEYNEWGALSQTYRYTYTTGLFNYWTTKFVEVRDGNEFNSFKPYEKEIREIDGNKRLTRRQVFGWNWNNGDEVFELEEDTKYDYSHAYEGEDGELVYGHATERIENFGNTKETYEWFEPAKAYVCTLRSNYGWVFMKTTFGSDNYTMSFFEIDENDNLYKQYEEAHYFDNGKEIGSKSISYNRDGSVNYADGHLEKTEENTPEQGYNTTIGYYCNSQGEFVLSSKNVWKGENSELYIGNYENTYYDYQDGEWVMEEKRKRTDLGNHLFRIDVANVTDSYDYTYYVKANDEGYSEGQVIMNEDGSYTTISQTWASDAGSNEYIEICYIESYNANHNLTRVIKRVRNTPSPIGNQQLNETYTFYVKENGQWELMSSYEETIMYGLTKQRTIYSFTTEGYPAAIETYDSHPTATDGKEVLVYQKKYTYASNGYTSETYERVYKSYDYQSGSMQLTGKEEYYILADGTYRETRYEYDEDKPGVITYATRREEKDGITKGYDYNKSSQAFELSYAWCDDLEETTEDGVTVTIHRNLSDDYSTVIYTGKSETKVIRTEDGEYYMFADYEWDEYNNIWVGTQKGEGKWVYLPFFYYTPPADPISSYTDEYLDDETDEKGWPLRTLDGYTDYEWNPETQEWIVRYKSDFEIAQTTDNILEYKEMWEDNYSESSATTRLERDASGKLIKQTVTKTNRNKIYDDEASVKTTTVSYTYNINGYIETKTTEELSNNDDPKVTVERYEYTQHSLIPTRIETIEAQGKADITVADGKISTGDESSITLYDTSGRLIATGKGSIDLPTTGLYIVKTRNGSTKISVK